MVASDAKVAPAFAYRIGADENGLGARLGPLVVTAVLAEVTEPGIKALSRKLPKKIRKDLDDSKELVSHGNVALGEAWARALLGFPARDPAEVFEALSLEGTPTLRALCPSHVGEQCWRVQTEEFSAEPALVERVAGHLAWWQERGIHVRAVRSSVLCTKHLNDARTAGRNRFVADLHAMERLVLSLREAAGNDVLAVCGKVGGIDDYSRFFGPLSSRLHSVLARGKKASAYHFPGVGEIRFLRDADALDPFVMLASLVGKYVRELLMGRVSAYYTEAAQVEKVSGYHDPATTRFVAATALVRRERNIPDQCFERARDEV